jgi:hypothetical protein
MKRSPVTFATVVQVGRTLPDTEVGTSWGAPALKVHGRMFACGATHKSAEPNTLVVRMDFDQRDELIAADPVTYYLKEHYVNYACVLVRLDRVHPDALRDLLSTGCRFVSRSQRRVTRTGAKTLRRASPATGTRRR